MIRPRRAENRDVQTEQVADDALPVKVSRGALFIKCKTSPALKRTQPLIFFCSPRHQIAFEIAQVKPVCATRAGLMRLKHFQSKLEGGPLFGKCISCLPPIERVCVWQVISAE